MQVCCSTDSFTVIDNVKQGAHLMQTAQHLIQGGLTYDKLGEAKQLYAGATSFFRGLKHMGEPHKEGLDEEHFEEDWKAEHKWATMFSGCRDDQTSADASIEGANVGAMSWAFLESMKRNANPTYIGVSHPQIVNVSKLTSIVQTLQLTRQILGQSNYKQVPQLSVGLQLDLNTPLLI